jgi:hypothetical protein
MQVRLLTGVGRYTEMNYIFQMLKDNEQFEFLLGKGLDKVNHNKCSCHSGFQCYFSFLYPDSAFMKGVQ